MTPETINIHSIHLEGDDEFSKRFNEISDLFEKSYDEKYTEEERNDFFDQWLRAKCCLELGIN